MYLVIFEDGSMVHVAELEDDMLSGADDGLLDLVDIRDPAHPLRYWDEGWCSVDVPGAAK